MKKLLIIISISFSGIVNSGTCNSKAAQPEQKRAREVAHAEPRAAVVFHVLPVDPVIPAAAVVVEQQVEKHSKEATEELFKAIEIGNFEAVQKAIANKADIYSKFNGRTPLFECISRAEYNTFPRADIMQYLINLVGDQPLDINESYNEKTIISMACDINNKHLYDFIYKHRAQLNEINKKYLIIKLFSYIDEYYETPYSHREPIIFKLGNILLETLSSEQGLSEAYKRYNGQTLLTYYAYVNEIQESIESDERHEAKIRAEKDTAHPVADGPLRLVIRSRPKLTPEERERKRQLKLWQYEQFIILLLNLGFDPAAKNINSECLFDFLNVPVIRDACEKVLGKDLIEQKIKERSEAVKAGVDAKSGDKLATALLNLIAEYGC